MKILIVEDNQKLAGYMKKAFEQESFEVDCVFDGEVGEMRAKTNIYKLIILDIMLPGKDGVSVCKSLRSKNIITPIIMLTAKDAIEDKISGLDSGADDYIVKPFALDELFARVKSLLRRSENRIGQEIQIKDIIINMKTFSVIKNDVEVLLTQKEFEILSYLMRNAGTVVTRDNIIQNCWDFSYDSFTNIIDVYIKRIRDKINDSDSNYIKTIRNVGYEFQK